ncbi:hypothetical protein HSB1_47920 [Halogranum salarium B-1]|uniref:Uncharacterized protein n=1 Tax=Halogranum salarium B-1 TaxID=1210908 RepID=J2Z8N0_9EURY|nr:hypothetical protein HSB1_47920 [Halogranum salarium B-1]
MHNDEVTRRQPQVNLKDPDECELRSWLSLVRELNDSPCY